MKPAIVGIVGKKRVGKDTFASVLVEQFGFTRLAFADPLRDVALATNPIVHVELDKNGDPDIMRLQEAVEEFGYERAKDMFPEVRALLQRLGTDGVRKIDDNFWTRAWASRAMDAPGSVVAPDVRFPNEADLIRNAGGIIVRITRDTGLSSDSHASENALDFYPEDVHIPNNYSEDTLKRLAYDLGRDLGLIVAAAHRRHFS